MSDIPTILERIIARKQEEVESKKQNLEEAKLIRNTEKSGSPGLFFSTLSRDIDTRGTAIIAEIKKASPSKGVIRKDFDAEKIALSYTKAGATCLSVLTDEEFFQGRDEYVGLVKKISDLPVLRKDFIIDSYQVYESRKIGADCILLIAAVLKDSQLREFSDIATSLGMDVLVEVHNREELERAHVLRTPLIGINNRDLNTFDTSLETTTGLLHDVFPDRLLVTESGIHNEDDVNMLKRHGVRAFLIGEAFMGADDPGQELKTMFNL